MSYSALPPALLELTLLRVASPKRIPCPNRWRRMYQTTVSEPSGSAPSSGQLSWEGLKRTRVSKHISGIPLPSPIPSTEGMQVAAGDPQLSLNPLEELEKRVGALDEVLETQSNTVTGQFFYAEDELLSLYEDVLAIEEPVTDDFTSNKLAMEAVRRAEAMEDTRLLAGLQQRLLDDATVVDDTVPLYRKILAKAHEIFARVEAARNAVNPEGSDSYLPLALISVREYEGLIRISVGKNDNRAATIAQEMMKREKLTLPRKSLSNILKVYAAAGNIDAADDLLVNFLKEAPTEGQRHLHIKTHLNGTPKNVIPTSAMELLHHYESQNIPVAMNTYTSVITALLSRPSSLARAQAWDLFAHMRYAAHPDPDTTLYTHMIRACASPVSIRYSSEPEKALDLWTEMTVDHKLRPTVASYNAAILACARSGTKRYVNEAFRLARQMLDSHRNARGVSAYAPDRDTFCALLEGAKRLGDLGRARWILSEMVRVSGSDANGVQTRIDEEVMMHVFNAYASYKPPATNIKTIPAPQTNASTEVTKAVTRAVTKAAPSSAAASGGPSAVVNHDYRDDDELLDPSFTMAPPQTREEVIREVRMLFGRIIQDAATSSIPHEKFSAVTLSSRLLGAYLSVFYRHAPLETSMQLFGMFSDKFEHLMSPRVYVEALERCANARRVSHERETVLPFMDRLWEKWESMEDTARRNDRPLSARYVERAHVAKIRTLAVAEKIDRGMEHLRAFAAKYPPNQVREPAPKPAFRSTRSTLIDNRPLVRMTSAAEVPDDHVPPLVTFRDVEVLHHRLVDDARTKDINYITWLCKAYEWALRVRRDETVKAKIAPPGTPVYVAAH